jgi:hypothetical protein
MRNPFAGRAEEPRARRVIGRTRIAIVSAIVAAGTIALAATAALATPAQVNVRIEGRSETLFEGPIMAEGHYVEASSDTEPRSCDGINPLDPENLAPGPTPTSSSSDAMRIIGETFDAQWYPSFDDYFLTRWGPDEESLAESAYWGVLVNNVFTDVGGCQYELGDGDEVLWLYDAFKGRKLLALYPAGYPSGERPLTATAELGKPFKVEVVDYPDQNEDQPPALPERRGTVPVPGAEVAPVRTSASGFEKVLAEDPATVTSNAQGEASITFTEPGWHRIKATSFETIQGAGGETRVQEQVRSNRLDVCVPAKGATTCPDPFPEDQIRMAPPPISPPEGKSLEPEPAPEEPASSSGGTALKTSPLLTSPVAGGGSSEPLRLEAPRLNGQGAAQGLIGVSWRVLSAGVGLKDWSIAAKSRRSGGAGYRVVATGASATSALLSLPPGFAYQLQITFTDSLGRSSAESLGQVLVPRDDRAKGLRYVGGWRRAALPGAWQGTVSQGSTGARVSLRLGAGRPVFMLRRNSRAATIEVRCGPRRERFRVSSGQGSASLVTGVSRARAEVVSLRVLQGAVDLDGVAVEA